MAWNSSEIELERAPRVHWRKCLAAAQKLDRKNLHEIGRKPGNAINCHLLATPPVPLNLSQQPKQLQLPAPSTVLPPGDPDMVRTRTTPKLRQHHHEFLSEYCQV